MKKIKLSMSLLAATLLVFTSCDSDDATNDSINENTNPIVNYDIPFGNNVTTVETDITYSYTVQLSDAQFVDTYVPVSLVGGTATEHEDFDFDHSLVISKGSSDFVTGTVTIYRDTDVEPTETFTLRIGDTVLNANSTPQEITFTLENYVSCVWTLVTSDTYGDGWNGGYVELTSEGVTTQYSEDDNVSNTFLIDITDGADYEFKYVSGGGTGAAPGWESENYFSLTAPDGTFWEEGTMDYSGIPTDGVITSGTNVCP